MAEHEDEEESGVPGSDAHRSELLEIINEKNRIPHTIAQGLGLTPAAEEQIRSIIQAAYRQPFLSLAGAIEVMENLLKSPKLGPGTLYDQIEDYRSIMLRHVAARCYAAGMKASQTRDDE